MSFLRKLERLFSKKVIYKLFTEPMKAFNKLIHQIVLWYYPHLFVMVRKLYIKLIC